MAIPERYIVTAVVAIPIGVVLVIGVLWFLGGPDHLSGAKQLATAASAVGSLVLIGAMTGLGAMATVQFWKVAYRPRVGFHKLQLREWFGNKGFKSLCELLVGSESFETKNRRAGQSGVDTGSHAALDDLLDSPTEVLVAQIENASEYVILHPKDHRGLLQGFAGRPGEAAVKKFLGVEAEEGQSSEASGGEATLGRPAEESNAEALDDDQLYPVRHFVEQNLDLLLIRLRERWRRRVRLIASAMAAVIALLVSWIAPVDPTIKLTMWAVSAVWGGFFAWFARDLVAGFERRRG